MIVCIINPNFHTSILLVAFTQPHQVKKMYPHTSLPIFSLIFFTDTILNNVQPTCDKPHPMPDKPHPTDRVAYTKNRKPHPTDRVAYNWTNKSLPTLIKPHQASIKPHLFFKIYTTIKTNHHLTFKK